MVPEPLPGDRIKSKKAPNIYTYAQEAPGQLDKIQNRTAVWTIAKPRGSKEYKRVTYTKMLTNLKKFVPGVGSYTPNYSKIAENFTNHRV